MALVLLFVLGAAWVLTPARPEKIKELPTSFPVSIPLYKIEDASRLTFLSAERKKRGPEAAAFIPKLILTPVLLAIHAKNETVSTTLATARRGAWQEFKTLVKSPLLAYHDTVTITWEHLNPEPDFLDEWYYTELTKKSFTVTRQFVSTTLRKLDFTGVDARGIITIDDAEKNQGTDSVMMEVDY